MYKKISIFFISALLSLQLNHEATIAFDPVEKATELLNTLKSNQSTVLSGLFAAYYLPYSNQVDSAAQVTKDSGKDDALIKCVNDQATEAINTIFSEYMASIVNYMKPIVEVEKRAIACALTDKECFNGVVEELQNIIDLLENNIETEVAADSETILKQVSLVESCGNQSADRRNVTKLAGVADDAQEALNTLRQVTLDRTIKYADSDYIGMMINEVNSTARCVKAFSRGDQQKECVNRNANETIDFIYAAYLTLTQTFFKRLYDAEIQLVVCGASDEECIKTVITDLQNETRSTQDEVANQRNADIEKVNDYVATMTACESTAGPCIQQDSGAIENFIVTGIENFVLILFTIIMYIIQ